MTKRAGLKTDQVFVAISGGIDSAFSAYLIKRQYQNVKLIHARLWEEGDGCKGQENVEESKMKASSDQFQRVKQIAEDLKLPLKIIDLRKEFKNRIVDYYLRHYEKGLTPNPCIVCNREIKFGLLRKKVKDLGGALIATGHYVKKEVSQIYRGKDRQKDQSYFMWDLNPKVIEEIIFPLGDYRKEKVKNKVKAANFSLDFEEESKGVCFYPKGAHQKFIKKYGKKLNQPGKIVDQEGQVVGRHKGLACYTIGQRYGFDIDPRKMGLAGQDIPPLYVVKILPQKNQLVVGKDKDLYQDKLRVHSINWLAGKPPKKGDERKIDLQIRHLGRVVKAKLKALGRDKARVELESQLRSVAPGQSAVFYDKDHLLGGGLIQPNR